MNLSKFYRSLLLGVIRLTGNKKEMAVSLPSLDVKFLPD